MNNITISYINSGEVRLLSEFVEEVFLESVAPGYQQQGIATFMTFIQPDHIKERINNQSFVLVARTGETINGIIEMRNYNHISLLFVKRAFQKNGIARKLFQSALEICKKNDPELKTITVNSSPGAVFAYQHLGFKISNPEKTLNGIRFTPMNLNLSDF